MLTQIAAKLNLIILAMKRNRQCLLPDVLFFGKVMDAITTQYIHQKKITNHYSRENLIIMNISQINSVRIEISNVCNLSCAGCPITVLPAGTYLKFELIKKVIDELKKLDYTGDIGFHRYNEPLFDPRIWDILDINPFHTVIYTNGVMLTNEVRTRLSRYDLEIVYTDHTLKMNKLDPRLNIYKWKPVEFTRCGRENQLTINYKGEMVLCCYDWKNTVTFGNIRKERLEDMLEKMPYLPRNFDICLRCNNWGGKVKNRKNDRNN